MLRRGLKSNPAVVAEMNVAAIVDRGRFDNFVLQRINDTKRL